MKKRNNRYFIGYLPDDVSCDFDIVNELHDDIDYVKNVDIERFTSQGIQFVCEIPSESGSLSYCDDIKSKRVLKYDTLVDLIDDYIFGFEPSEFTEDDEIENDVENEFNPEDRLYDFFEEGEFIVIKQNIKTKKYSLVSRDTIENCFNQLIDKIENQVMNDIKKHKFDESNYILDIDMDGFYGLFDNFLDFICGQIEQDSCQVTISADANNYYLFSMIKEGSKLHKEIVENGDDINAANKNGYIFDGDYDDCTAFVLHNLKQGIPLGCAVTTIVTDYDVEDESKIFTKCYGYVIGFKENEVVINQIPAKEVAKGNTFNAESGKELESRRNIIYCGYKKDDIICGFDL